jgi:hypothetical protein
MSIIGKLDDDFHVETTRNSDGTTVVLECWKRTGHNRWLGPWLGSQFSSLDRGHAQQRTLNPAW